jgi:signal transduction histidine kinase
MKPSEVILVGLPPRELEVACKAATRAYPGSPILTFGEWDEDLDGASPASGKLLVLSDATVAAAANRATDAGGSPRWAVVLLGNDASGLTESVPAKDWKPALLARVFRTEMIKHGLVRENLRLRGDLKTVARHVRHDLLTPVGCIATYTHFLPELFPDGGPQSAAMIENIRTCSNEITGIINRVSFVLRASADPLPLAAVDMKEVIAAALEQLESEDGANRGRISQSDSWPVVAGVASWLQVIWWNLLSNALKHGGKSAQVQIGWSRSREPDGYRFSVIDRGEGVLRKNRKHLFSPFEQLHAIDFRNGLGLSIVQRLLALQGGRCGYETPRGGGSCFYFTLQESGALTGNRTPV